MDGAGDSPNISCTDVPNKLQKELWFEIGDIFDEPSAQSKMLVVAACPMVTIIVKRHE